MVGPGGIWIENEKCENAQDGLCGPGAVGGDMGVGPRAGFGRLGGAELACELFGGGEEGDLAEIKMDEVFARVPDYAGE